VRAIAKIAPVVFTMVNGVNRCVSSVLGVVMGIEPDCPLKNHAKVALLEDTARKMVD
jgi:hypothetical protein